MPGWKVQGKKDKFNREDPIGKKGMLIKEFPAPDLRHKAEFRKSLNGFLFFVYFFIHKY